jgi:hypothetical protein
VIIYGLRWFGPVDGIPGIGEVQTRFVHIWFIPLVPTGSMFVTAETEGGISGLKVPLSFRSIFKAWLRTFLFFSTIGLLFGGGASLINLIANAERLGHGAKLMDQALNLGSALGGTVCGFLGALIFGLMWWFSSGWMRVAKGAREQELRRRLGLVGDEGPQEIAL